MNASKAGADAFPDDTVVRAYDGARGVVVGRRNAPGRSGAVLRVRWAATRMEGWTDPRILSARTEDQPSPEAAAWASDPVGNPGKRTSTDDPLTEHDVAERLDHAALRTLRILMETRQQGLMPAVSSSRYLGSGLLDMLAAELQEWGATPNR